MKRIWFIRHAESAANAGLPTTRPDTIPLTNKGMQQAQALADLLSDAPDLIIMTPYLRTQQTAKPLREKFPQVPTEIWPFYEFDFLSPALCAGTTVAERKPWVSEYWQRCDPCYVHGTGAESFAEFKSRIVSGLKNLEKYPYDFIIVFAHGHVMRGIWQYLITGNSVFDKIVWPTFGTKSLGYHYLTPRYLKHHLKEGNGGSRIQNLNWGPMIRRNRTKKQRPLCFKSGLCFL